MIGARKRLVKEGVGKRKRRGSEKAAEQQQASQSTRFFPGGPHWLFGLRIIIIAVALPWSFRFGRILCLVPSFAFSLFLSRIDPVGCCIATRTVLSVPLTDCRRPVHTRSEKTEDMSAIEGGRGQREGLCSAGTLNRKSKANEIR